MLLAIPNALDRIEKIIEGDRNSVPILGSLYRLTASFNKVKNCHSLRSFGRANSARPFKRALVVVSLLPFIK